MNQFLNSSLENIIGNMDLTFEKWEDGRWFVVLPDYDGDQEDLEMVDGADKEAVI